MCRRLLGSLVSFLGFQVPVLDKRPPLWRCYDPQKEARPRMAYYLILAMQICDKGWFESSAFPRSIGNRPPADDAGFHHDFLPSPSTAGVLSFPFFFFPFAFAFLPLRSRFFNPGVPAFQISAYRTKKWPNSSGDTTVDNFIL